MIEHHEAEEYLAEYAAGRRDKSWAVVLERHLQTCSDCRDWLESYQLLSDFLASSPPQEHLDSQELCDYALQPAVLDPASREHCESHFAVCERCRREVGLVQAAAGNAVTVNFAAAAPRGHGWTSRLMESRSALSAAAALALVIGGLLLVSKMSSTIPNDYHLVGRSVRGVQSIQTTRSIAVKDTAVEAGSRLDLKSEMVAFEEGFSVRDGAALIVASSGPADHEDSSEI